MEGGYRKRREILPNARLQPGEQCKSTCRICHVIDHLVLSLILEEAGTRNVRFQGGAGSASVQVERSYHLPPRGLFLATLQKPVSLLKTWNVIEAVFKFIY